MALTDADRGLLNSAQQAQIANYTKQWEAASAVGDAAGMAAAHAGAEAVRNSATTGYKSDSSGAFAGYTGSGPGGGTGSASARSSAQGSGSATASPAASGSDALLRQYMNLYDSQQGAYAKALAEQKAAQEAAVQRAVNSLESQKSNTNNAYSNLYRQAYIDNMNAKKNINQRLAAQGVSGGAAESTLLGLSTSYADALRQAEQSRIGAISDLDQAISDARLTGDIQSANAAVDSAREQTANYSNVLQSLIDRYDNLNARQTAYDREDAANALAYDRESAETVRRYAYQTAMGMLNSGVMASDELLESAGIGKADAAAIVAANTPTESYTPSLTAAQVNAAIKSGVLTAEVLRAYEYYYGAPYRG